jgi:sugar/nucleoside kinase (ribokinase family)
MPDVDVVCVGGAKLDLNALVDEYPLPDSRTLIDSFQIGIGGQAITAAVAIARLGVPVAYCGVIGRDAGGDQIMARLEEEAIDTRWVERRAGIHTSRSMNLIVRNSKTRTIVTERAPRPNPAIIETLQAKWLHIDDVGYPGADILAKNIRSGLRISVDAGNPIDGLNLHDIDLYVPTLARLEDEYGSELAGDALLARARKDGARTVVATDGAAGAYVLGENFRVVRGFEVEVVSTLGAGDVFHGAILAALCLGKPLEEAALWANAAAALSCRGLDGQSMTPTRVELEAFLARHERPETPPHHF